MSDIKPSLVILFFVISASMYLNQDIYGQADYYFESKYYKEIKINEQSFEGILKNFPLLVTISEDHDLQNHVRGDGTDIFFVNSNDKKLPFEIERWDSKSGTLIAWVKLNLTEDDNSFFIHYGNHLVTSNANDCTTWNENYLLVLHLDNNFDDSSCKQTHGDNYRTLQKDGKIGKGTEFNGQSSFVNLGNIEEFDNLTELTASAWVWNNDLDSDAAIISKWGDDGNSFLFSMDKEIGSDESLRTNFYSFLVYEQGSTSPHTSKRINSSIDSAIANQWQFVVGSFKQNDKGDLRLWIDGIEDSDGNIYPKTVTSIFPTKTDVIVGATQHENDRRFFDGILDEIRITKAKPDQNWLKAEYNNQKNPATFYNIGPEVGKIPWEIIPIVTGLGIVVPIFIAKSRKKEKPVTTAETNFQLPASNITEGRKALVIGISEYDDERLEQLEYCKNDAKEMTYLLSSLGYRVKNPNFTGRVSGISLRDSIIDFFNDDDILSTDTIILYFSGHGISEIDDTFFASSDFDKDNPQKRGFSFTELKNAMNKSISRKIVVILDCCYSGAASLGKGDEGNATIGHKKIKNIMEKNNVEGKCLLLSSQDYQKSYLLEKKGLSLYTHYILEGLRGKEGSLDSDGNVTVQTLSRYVYDKVTEVSKQRPLIDSQMSGDIVLVSFENSEKNNQLQHS